MLTQLLANCLLHNAKPPSLQSILPSQAINQIRSGKLPDIHADKLVLKAGEKCRYIEMGAIVTQKKYSYRWNSGSSSRWWKGFTHHVNTGESMPMYEPEFTEGFLYFTDERIVFVAGKYGFDKRISKLSAITEYSDAISLQFGDKTYTILLPDGCIAKETLNLLI